MYSSELVDSFPRRVSGKDFRVENRVEKRVPPMLIFTISKSDISVFSKAINVVLAHTLEITVHCRKPSHGVRIVTLLTLEVPETKIVKFANSVDLDEVTHNEPPHLDLHCLSSSLEFSI